MQHDATKSGFLGDDNLYGIGIRVGYYTQALSLWIANLWVPHEAPFLHSVNILFLIAILIGVSALCRNPSTTFAVEPFMLLQIAYNTVLMGLGGFQTPDLLPWEWPWLQGVLTDLAMLGLFGFECWFWWAGLKKLKPTDGPNGTVVYYPWVGRQDLYGWICVAARVVNAVFLVGRSKKLVSMVFWERENRRLDKLFRVDDESILKAVELWKGEVEAARRDRGARAPKKEGKINSQDAENITLKREIGQESPARFPVGLGISDRKSSICVDSADSKTASIITPTTSNISVNTTCTEKQGHPPVKSFETNLDHSWSPCLSPTPTMPVNASDISPSLTKRLPSKSKPTKFIASSTPLSPSTSSSYWPSLHSLQTSSDFFAAVIAPPKHRNYRFLRGYYEAPMYIGLLLPLIFTTPFRPRLLLALFKHISLLPFYNPYNWPRRLHRALTHSSFGSINVSDFELMSRLKLTLEPPCRPGKKEMWLWCMVMFSTFSVMVIGTELTINWNDIRGVQNIGSVGQLIPASLGIGGLIKVAWSWAQGEEERARWCFGVCVGERRARPWKRIAKAWEEAWEELRRAKTETEVVLVESV